MSKKKPKVPLRIVVEGIPYKLVVMEVTGKFPNGTPRYCSRIPEEATVRVDTPEPKEFITVYVRQSALVPSTKG